MYLEAADGNTFEGDPDERRALAAYIKLVRAANTLVAMELAELREAGLTESQFGVLEALLHLGPMCQKDLAAKILRTSGNLTTVVDNLERDGLVVRHREARDRRVVTVHLTDKGRRLKSDVFPRHVSVISRWFSVLDSAEQECLVGLLRRLGRQVTEG